MSAMTHEHDPEKGHNGTKGKDLGESPSPEYDAGMQMDAEKQPWNRRFIDSFKRDPNAHVTNAAMPEGREFDHKGAAERTANSGLAHKLKSRHMQMIAIGGSIGEFAVISRAWPLIDIVSGTGLFVTSGAALANGGPASLIIAFALIGVLMVSRRFASPSSIPSQPFRPSPGHSLSWSSLFIDE